MPTAYTEPHTKDPLLFVHSQSDVGFASSVRFPIGFLTLSDLLC